MEPGGLVKPVIVQAMRVGEGCAGTDVVVRSTVQQRVAP